MKYDQFCAAFDYFEKLTFYIDDKEFFDPVYYVPYPYVYHRGYINKQLNTPRENQARLVELTNILTGEHIPQHMTNDVNAKLGAMMLLLCADEGQIIGLDKQEERARIVKLVNHQIKPEPNSVEAFALQIYEAYEEKSILEKKLTGIRVIQPNAPVQVYCPLTGRMIDERNIKPHIPTLIFRNIFILAAQNAIQNNPREYTNRDDQDAIEIIKEFKLTEKDREQAEKALEELRNGKAISLTFEEKEFNSPGAPTVKPVVLQDEEIKLLETWGVFDVRLKKPKLAVELSQEAEKEEALNDEEMEELNKAITLSLAKSELEPEGIVKSDEEIAKELQEEYNKEANAVQQPVQQDANANPQQVEDDEALARKLQEELDREIDPIQQNENAVLQQPQNPIVVPPPVVPQMQLAQQQAEAERRQQAEQARFAALGSRARARQQRGQSVARQNPTSSPSLPVSKSVQFWGGPGRKKKM